MFVIGWGEEWVNLNLNRAPTCGPLRPPEWSNDATPRHWAGTTVVSTATSALGRVVRTRHSTTTAPEHSDLWSRHAVAIKQMESRSLSDRSRGATGPFRLPTLLLEPLSCRVDFRNKTTSWTDDIPQLFISPAVITCIPLSIADSRPAKNIWFHRLKPRNVVRSIFRSLWTSQMGLCQNSLLHSQSWFRVLLDEV